MLELTESKQLVMLNALGQIAAGKRELVRFNQLHGTLN